MTVGTSRKDYLIHWYQKLGDFLILVYFKMYFYVILGLKQGLTKSLRIKNNYWLSEVL